MAGAALGPVLEDVAALVRAARETAGKTQDEAAYAAGIDYKRWQRIEAGEVNVTVRTLVRIAEACDTDFWSLLCRTRKR